MPVPAGSGGRDATYADADTLKRRMGIPDADTTNDDDIDDALTSATDAITRWTGRWFGQDGSVSARSYVPTASGVDTDDFWTTDGLLIDGTAYDVDTYTLEPRNGIADGTTGWAYNRLTYPYYASPLFSPLVSVVEVTAAWGWPAIPAGIRQACLLLAADDLKSKDAPFGVAGFGDYAVRIRSNPKVAEKLAPYIRTPIRVA